MPTKVLLISISRSGTNHFLASLHYQPGIWSFSERVHYPNTSPIKNCFGFKDDKEKFKSASVICWKFHNELICDWWDNASLPPIDSDIKLFVLFRHPYLLFNSIKKLQKSRGIKFSFDDFRFIYAKFFALISTIKFYPVFYESLVLDYDKTMNKILDIVKPENDFIYTYKEYFAKNDNVIGYGGYDYKRKIDTNEMIKIIKENNNIFQRLPFVKDFVKKYYENFNRA